MTEQNKWPPRLWIPLDVSPRFVTSNLKSRRAFDQSDYKGESLGTEYLGLPELRERLGKVKWILNAMSDGEVYICSSDWNPFKNGGPPEIDDCVRCTEQVSEALAELEKLLEQN